MAQPRKIFAEELPELPDEATHLGQELECLEDMQATIKSLRMLVNTAAIADHDRQVLRYQLTHMQHHLTQSVNRIAGDTLLKNN